MILKLIDYLHQTFGIGKDETANILVTILTFSLGLGIILTLLFKTFENFLQRRNHKKLLKLNLLNLIKGLYKQAIGFEKLSNQLVIEHNGSFNFFPTSISATGILNELGYKNLHGSLFTGFENIRFKNHSNKRIAFNNVWATVDFLNVFHGDSMKLNKEFFELNAEANEKRNSSLGNVMQIVESIRLSLHGENIPHRLGQYFESIEDILLNLRGQENYSNPQITNDDLVIPLLALNRRNVSLIKEFGSILRPIELNAALLESEIRYINQKNLIEAYHYNFKELKNSFLKNYKKMQNSYRVLFR